MMKKVEELRKKLERAEAIETLYERVRETLYGMYMRTEYDDNGNVIYKVPTDEENDWYYKERYDKYHELSEEILDKIEKMI